MIGTWLAKVAVSLVIAMWMYWMRLPYAVAVMLIAQGLDLLEGMLIAAAKREFQGRKLYTGIMLKIAVWPVLVISDLMETPMHISFHLEIYAAWFFFAYEVQSIIGTYGTVRPLPKVIRIAADKLSELFSASPDFDTKKVETMTKTVTIQPTADTPIAPAAIVTTITKETHNEPVGSGENK
jgi:phage-related holin